MLGEVEPPNSLCRTRPEPLDQTLKIVLKSTQAPDLPPHFPAGRWESRHVIGPERFESRLANGLDGFDESLTPRIALASQFAFLIFAENVEEHLARFIGNVESDDADVGLFTPGGTGHDPVFFSFYGFYPCAAFQLDLEKGAFRRPDSLVLTSCSVECPIGGGKLSAQFRAVLLTTARRPRAAPV